MPRRVFSSNCGGKLFVLVVDAGGKPQFAEHFFPEHVSPRTAAQVLAEHDVRPASFAQDVPFRQRHVVQVRVIGFPEIEGHEFGVRMRFHQSQERQCRSREQVVVGIQELDEIFRRKFHARVPCAAQPCVFLGHIVHARLGQLPDELFRLASGRAVVHHPHFPVGPVAQAHDALHGPCQQADFHFKIRNDETDRRLAHEWNTLRVWATMRQ